MACAGREGKRKSAFLKRLAEYLLKHAAAFWIFAAHSGESLAWLRSLWRKEKRILLLSSENAIVEPPDGVEKAAEKLSLKGFNRYYIIINSCILYPNIIVSFTL